MTKEAKETIYNFNGNNKDLSEEVKKSIEYWKNCGLEIDTIELTFSEEAKFQSDPDEGNLPKKQ